MTLDRETPTRLWDDVVIDDVDLPADRPERRRAAVVQAISHAEPATRDRRGAVGIRRYDPGSFALALRGRFDRCAREILQGLVDELPRVARTELVIDLSGLDRCDAALARAVARLRIRCLARGARVELHDPPPAVTVELGQR